MILMVLASTCAVMAGPSKLPELTVPDCLGVNIHFTGPERAQVDQIAAGGFKFIRMDFAWDRIEKAKGVYDYKAYDELVDSLASKGIRALFILDYGNNLYDDGLAPHTDEARAAYAKYAAAAAAHFKGKGVLWEIWNEPNGGFWRPQAKAEDYVLLAKATYPAMKKADPGCTILAPALAGWDYAFIENAFKLGLLDATDVVSLHPYGAAKPEDAAMLYGRVRDLVRQYAPKGKDYPIVSGEWGYSTFSKGVSNEVQADYIARQFLSNMLNNCRLSIWYDWHDDGPNPDENEHRFGTVQQDFTPKPSYIAVRTLTTELNGYSFAGRLGTDSKEDYLALFKKGDDYRLVAWTTGSPHSVTLPVDVIEVELVSRSGERTTPEFKDGKLTLKLTGSPQYVEPKGKSLRWAIESRWNPIVAAELTNDGLVLKANDVIRGVFAQHSEFSVSGTGVDEYTVKTDLSKVGHGPARLVDRGGIGHNLSTPYQSVGHSGAVVTVTLKLEGIDEPIVRVVEVDTSVCPTVDVLPPMGNEIPIVVHRPIAGAKGAFEGKLMLGNPDGVQLEQDTFPVKLAKGEDSVTIHAKTSRKPTAFAFGCNLVDSKDRVVVRMPAKRYAIVESFAGKPGTSVFDYGVGLDGDANVKAEAKLTYTAAPKGGPDDACAKLDYSFDPGWKFVRIYKDGLVPIEGHPRVAKIWVKGDGGSGVGRLRLEDAGGETFQPDFGTINFTDWRCIEADMSGANCGHWGGKNTGRMEYPIKWETMFLFDNVGGRQTKGTIYLGPMMLCYD